MDFRSVALSNTVAAVVVAVVSVVLSLAGFGVWSLVLGTLAGAATSSLFLAVRSRYVPRLHFRLARGETLRLLRRCDDGLGLLELRNEPARPAHHRPLPRHRESWHLHDRLQPRNVPCHEDLDRYCWSDAAGLREIEGSLGRYTRQPTAVRRGSRRSSCSPTRDRSRAQQRARAWAVRPPVDRSCHPLRHPVLRRNDRWAC